MLVFYTNEINSFLYNHLKDPSFYKILELLENDSSQDFTNAYAQRIGCFEYGDVHPWSEDPEPPFRLYCHGSQYLFERSEKYKYDLTMHLIIYTRQCDIVFDNVITVNKNTFSKIIDVGELSDTGFEWVLPLYNVEYIA